jgi:hypothetical protein
MMPARQIRAADAAFKEDIPGYQNLLVRDIKTQASGGMAWGFQQFQGGT